MLGWLGWNVNWYVNNLPYGVDEYQSANITVSLQP